MLNLENKDNYNFGHYIENIHLNNICLTLKVQAVTGRDANLDGKENQLGQLKSRKGSRGSLCIYNIPWLPW